MNFLRSDQLIRINRWLTFWNKGFRKIFDRHNHAAHPFPLLLQLEWLLLGFVLLTTILTALISSFTELAIATLPIVIALGLMRLWFPTRHLIHQILYTTLEFGMILLPSLLGSRIVALPALALVVLIRSCQMFRWRGRLGVAALTFIFFFTSIPSREELSQMSQRIVAQPEHSSILVENPADLTSLIMRLNAALSFGLALIFILLLINALLEERQSRIKLTAAHEQLRYYALRIEDQSALQERNRIAREIHDSLGHTLTAQSIQLDSALLLLRSHPQPSNESHNEFSNIERAIPFLQTSKQLCTQALREVRQSVSSLRSDFLQGQSLEAAIAILLKDFRTTTTLTVDCTVELSRSASSEITVSLYRILQEALTNITRRSYATIVTIRVFEQNQSLYLLVQDNGKGFDPEQNSTGFGLQSMRERTVALKGRFTLVSQPGSGCLITVQIPLPDFAL